MTEFLATIKFIGGIVYLWKRFRALQARGEAEAWLKEMESAIDQLETANGSEAKRDSARHLMSLFLRFK